MMNRKDRPIKQKTKLTQQVTRLKTVPEKISFRCLFEPAPVTFAVQLPEFSCLNLQMLNCHIFLLHRNSDTPCSFNHLIVSCFKSTILSSTLFQLCQTGCLLFFHFKCVAPIGITLPLQSCQHVSLGFHQLHQLFFFFQYLTV